MLAPAYNPDLTLHYSQTLEAALASELGLIPDVRQVFLERAENDLLVWIALDHPTKDARERVFQKQYELIDGFPEVSFDFNLIASNARTPEEFAPAAHLIYSREG